MNANMENMTAALEKIRQYNKIIIFRHFRPDGDAVGSSRGLCGMLKLSYPDKEIYLCNADHSEYLSFLGGEDAPSDDSVFADALGIVLDTATKNRISSPKHELCKELLKIDHHISDDNYASTQWVEEERSSTCEMIVKLYDSFSEELKLDRDAATYLYTGMVTDSGRFRYRDVSGETLRLAGILLDKGVDTDRIYTNLYTKSADEFKFQSYVFKHIRFSENGVAHLYISRKTAKKYGLSFEEACASVSHMDAIRGSLIWIAFIEADDGNIRVRLRSRFVTVNSLAEKYGGGGHACACGANVRSKAEMRSLILDADKLLGSYKSENEGWL